MRYGYYSYFKPFCNALTHNNNIVKIEVEEIHQYNDDESEDVFYVLGYSRDVNDYLRRFIHIGDRIEVNDKNFDVKAINALRNNGFEPLF